MSAFRSLLLVASLVVAAVAVPAVAVPAAAQEAHEAAEGPASGAAHVDIITPHITDSHFLEIPTIFPPFAREVCIGHRVSEHECEALWKPVQIAGFTVDLSPTKHVVMLLFAATLVSLVLILTANAHKRQTHEVGHPKGFAAGIEAMVLYMRNEVILPNVGHHGNGFVPFLLTIFFFILSANLLGLIPYGSTATGNIAVTATLAIITFVVVEFAGMRAQGMGYLSTLFYWNNDLPVVMRVPMFLIMSPVEMIGKITKPFALAIRLFANMTAGHIVVLAFIGLIFTFAGPVSAAPFLMAVAIMLLEIFVAFLQAFIFTLLASVFIGQIRESHH
jgi:F-type H+-transporting ATPase subunit a